MNQRKTDLFLIFLIVLVNMVGVGIIIPVLAPIMLSDNSVFFSSAVSFEQKSIVYGFLISIYTIAQFFGAPILGAYSDKYGRKKMLIVSMAGTAFGFAIFAVGIITKQLWLLFASRIIDGFTGGNISIAMSSIADVSKHKDKTKNFGLIGMAFGLGLIIGPFIGGILADSKIISWFDVTTPFWFAAGISFINLLLIISLFKETLRHKRNSKPSFFSGARLVMKGFMIQKTRTLFSVIFMSTFGFTFFTTFFQVLLISRFMMTDPSSLGMLFGYLGVCIALTQGIVVRFASKRFGPDQLLKFSLPLFAIVLVMITLATEKWMIYALIPLLAIANGLGYPSFTALVSSKTGKKEQGEILGINQSVQSVAVSIPPIIGGYVAALGVSMPIIFGAASIFTGWLLFVFYYK